MSGFTNLMYLLVAITNKATGFGSVILTIMKSGNAKVLASLVREIVMEELGQGSDVQGFLDQSDLEDVFNGSVFQALKSRFGMQDDQAYSAMRDHFQQMSLYN